MKLTCIFCGNDEIEEKSELITDEFRGDSFIYTEVFCECIECGYHFVTAEMSTINLESRIAGKQEK